MNHFIIGSRYAATIFPDLPHFAKRAIDSDYDAIVPHPISALEKQGIKSELIDLYGTNKVEVSYIPKLYDILTTETDISVLRDTFFTLKASHVFYGREQKKKTMFDLFKMNSVGCRIVEPLFDEWYNYWIGVYGKEPWRADFTKESEEFFKDRVSREYVHDELHESVKLFHQPAFKFIQHPGQTTVWVDPELFWAQSEQIRRQVVIEEAQALALERMILPGTEVSLTIAYIKWVEALVDRLAPLWMTIYIINNLHYFLTLQFKNYANADIPKLKEKHFTKELV